MSRTSTILLLLVVLAVASLSASAVLLMRGQTAVSEAQPLPTATITETAVSTEPAAAAVLTPRPSPTAQPPALTVRVLDGTTDTSYETSAATIGDLLADEGMALGGSDSVSPAPESPLEDNMQIVISRAVPLTIQVDGQSLAIFSSAATVAEALSGAGVVLGELDQVQPALDSQPTEGQPIVVKRVREESIVFDEEVPYQTVYQPSDQLDLDTKALLSSGVPGILRRSTRIRYEDGVEVSRENEGEWLEREPVNEVIGYGTRITTQVIDTPEGPREYWRVVRMRVTAYTAASSGKSPDHPTYGITASGRPAGTGIVAVDPNVIPFRSEVYVPGYGVAFAGDTGGGVKGRWIDLGYDEDELQAWNSYVDVYYLTPLPAEINYLIPEVLP